MRPEGETLRLLTQTIDDFRIAFNRTCVHLEAWQIVSYTLSIAFLSLWLKRQFKDDRPIIDRLRTLVCFIAFLYRIFLLLCMEGFMKLINFRSAFYNMNLDLNILELA